MPNRPCVLVVDDDEQLRKVISGKLVREKIRVLVAANGEEGLRALDSDPAIRAVIVDLEMPVMDGESFCRTLRADTRYAKIPVLMISGSDDLERTATLAGATAWLHKPFFLEALISAVRRVLPR